MSDVKVFLGEHGDPAAVELTLLQSFSLAIEPSVSLSSGKFRPAIVSVSRTFDQSSADYEADRLLSKNGDGEPFLFKGSIHFYFNGKSQSILFFKNGFISHVSTMDDEGFPTQKIEFIIDDVNFSQGGGDTALSSNFD